MATKVNIYFDVKMIDGKMTPVPVKSDYFYDQMARNFEEGDEIVGVFRYPYEAHTDPQRRYLFGVVYDYIAEHTGHTTEEVHDVLMHDFFEPERVQVGDKVVYQRKSLTDCSKREVMDYIEHVKEWARKQLDVTIPDASETGHDIQEKHLFSNQE